MNYESAKARLGNKTRRKLQGNTYLELVTSDGPSKGMIKVIYHRTAVVIFTPDGRVQLNTGGWYTVTTKDRIKNWSPFTVHSEKGVFYINRKGDFAGARPYFDGMVFGADGYLTPDSAAYERGKLGLEQLS